MPSFRPSYKICPGDRLEVEVVQPDGGRALVVRKLDAVPEAAGGRALRIVVCDARITALPVQWGAEPVLADHCPSVKVLAAKGSPENTRTLARIAAHR